MHGYTAESSVDFIDILQNLNMAAMLNVEARKGRWGGWVDGIYLDVSTDADTPGSLLDSLGVDLQTLPPSTRARAAAQSRSNPRPC